MAWYWWTILVSFSYLSVGLVYVLASGAGGIIIGRVIEDYPSPWGPMLGGIITAMITLALAVLIWPAVAIWSRL